MSEQLLNVVNKQVADWTVLYVKLHNYHWYVKGKISLHSMRNLRNYIQKQLHILMIWLSVCLL